MTSKDYERVGGGTYGVYRRKKKSFWESVGELLGGLIFIAIALAILGAIFG